MTDDSPSSTAARNVGDASITVTPAAASPSRSGGLLRSLWAPRVFWAIGIGAVTSVALCAVLTLISWQLKLYGREWNVVWGADTVTLIWRGALLGFLIGWTVHSKIGFIIVTILAFLLLLTYEIQAMLLAFAISANAFSFPVALHFLIYTFTICSIVYFSLSRANDFKKPTSQIS